MTKKPDKIFVYGTLLKGEPRCEYLESCRLIKALEVPGALYATKRGYPAALFREGSEETVSGELYSIPNNPDAKLAELDEVEGVSSGLFLRKSLSYRNLDFYAYEAGDALKSSLRSGDKIRFGSWRRHSSAASRNPSKFAISFENLQRRGYREFSSDGSPGEIFIRGEIPILVTAPHATMHIRMDKPKRHEFYTGALSAILHSLTGSHCLYTHRASRVDPNYYDFLPFKKRLERILKQHEVKFLLDIHGTGSKKKDGIYPGIGKDKEFLLGNTLYLERLGESAESNGISVGSLDIFPAVKQMTVTKFAARNLNIPSMQIEINRRLRKPEDSPDEFHKLVQFLYEFILSLNLD